MSHTHDRDATIDAVDARVARRWAGGASAS
jgi:hypothetical protein